MHDPLNCLIIDDEPLARQLLRTFVLAKTNFTIVGICANPTEAYELLLNNNIQVIFLDIQMPAVSGIDFLRSLKRPPAIIFTTAFSSHAATAFDLNAVDYIVKPITEERFGQALEKLAETIKKKQIQADQNKATTPPVDYVFFKTDSKLVKVQLENILYLEALKDFTRIFLRNQSPLLIGAHLKSVESLLPEQNFVRVHRSYTISLSAISSIYGNIIEIGKIQIPIGSSYKDQLFVVLKIK
jgi:two-component system LytT family response regulator